MILKKWKALTLALTMIISQGALAQLFVIDKMFEQTAWDKKAPAFIGKDGVYFKYNISDSSYSPKSRIAISWNDNDKLLVIDDHNSSKPAKTYKVISDNKNYALLVNTEHAKDHNGKTKGHSSIIMYPIANNKVGVISRNFRLFSNFRHIANSSNGKYQVFISFIRSSSGGLIPREHLAFYEKLTPNELKQLVQAQLDNFFRESKLEKSRKIYSSHGYLRLNDNYANMYLDWKANKTTFRNDIDKRISWQNKRYPVLNDYSPLVIAASKPDLKKVLALIEEGYNVNASFKNWTPLLQAAQDGELEIVRALLDAGADIEQRTRKNTPLFSALKNTHVDVIKLLIERGADLNVRDYESLQTPIGRTVAYSQFSITELFLKAGANPCLLDRAGSTTVSRLPSEYNKKWKTILPKCY